MSGGCVCVGGAVGLWAAGVISCGVARVLGASL